MKFLNTKDMLISEGEDYNTLTFNIKADEAMELSVNAFVESVATQMVEVSKKIKLARIDNTQKYFMLFNSDIEDLEDLKQLASVVGTMLFKSLIKKKRHAQLAFFKLDNLGDIAITEMALGDLLKNKSKVKFINYAVNTKDKGLTFYMIGAEADEQED